MNFAETLLTIPFVSQFLSKIDQGSLLYFVAITALFLLGIVPILIVMATIGGLGTYAERKISADIQMRYGPNRVGHFGILQFLADGLKMAMKEDVIPYKADRFFFLFAPALCLTGVFGTLAVLPFSSSLTIANLDVGLVYIFAISSLVSLAVFLGGYASNSKWSMLGGMRGAAQIVSYEIPVILSSMSVVVLAGTLSMNEIVSAQTANPLTWFIFHNPFTFIGFFLFLIAGLAETNRAPFDLPEAESELVAGYQTEFSGMRYAFYALGEYIEVFVMCGIAVTLFLGGFNVPFNLAEVSYLGPIFQVAFFFIKALMLYYAVIWTRWTLPRIRVDHLMVLCWKYLTPISMFCLIGATFWVYLLDGKSLFVLIFG